VLFAYFYVISPGAVFRNNVTKKTATVKSKDDSRTKYKAISGHCE